jgi:glutaminyl-tRNA synthetase
VTEIHCTYDPTTKGGWSDDGRKVRGTLHWVSVQHAVDAEVLLYDHLFTVENPESGGEVFTENLNSDSLLILQNCKAEPGLKIAETGINYQFLRNGYFCLDFDSKSDQLIFNRTVGLRDNWAKKQK